MIIKPDRLPAVEVNAEGVGDLVDYAGGGPLPKKYLDTYRLLGDVIRRSAVPEGSPGTMGLHPSLRAIFEGKEWK